MSLFGIDKNWITDMFIGAGAGFIPIFFNTISSVVTLGLPVVPYAMGSIFRFITIGIAAPVFETIFFIGLLLSAIAKIGEENDSPDNRKRLLIILGLAYLPIFWVMVVSGLYFKAGMIYTGMAISAFAWYALAGTERSIFKKVPSLNLPFFWGALVVGLAASAFHAAAYGAFMALSAQYISAFLFFFGCCYLAKLTHSLLPPIVCHAVVNFYLLSIGFIIIAYLMVWKGNNFSEAIKKFDKWCQNNLKKFDNFIGLK